MPQSKFVVSLRARSRTGMLSALVCLACGAAVLLWPPQGARAAAITVGASGADYTTVQAAINHASPGDVIRVASGTYNETLDLSLMGSAISGPTGNLAIVAAGGPGTAVLAGSGTKIGESGSFAGTLVIDGLAFSSTSASAVKLTEFVNVTIANATFGPVGDGTSFPTDATADNALDLSRTSGAGVIAITNTTFNNSTDAAIALAFDGTASYTAALTGNTITDTNTSTIDTKRAITIDTKTSATALVTVDGNTITGIGTTGTQVITGTAASSSSLTTFVASNSISTITTTQPGISFNSTGTATVHATIADNTISDLSAAAGIRLAGVSGSTVDGRVMRNTLSNIGNAFPNHGISIDLPTGTPATSKFRIEGNSVNGCGGSGIKIRILSTSAAEVTAKNNSLLNCASDASQTNTGFYAQVGTGATDNADLVLHLTGNTVDGKNFRLENGETNSGTFSLEGDTTKSAQQNVDAANANGAGTTQIVGTVGVVPAAVTAPTEDRVPNAVDDTASPTEANATTIDVLANDTDPDGAGDARRLAAFDPISANGGTVFRDTNGTPGTTTDDKLVYTGRAGFSGTDTLYYVAGDGSGAGDVGKITVTVSHSAPTVAMSSLSSDPTHTSPIFVTVTFSASVTGFTSGDITPSNGTVQNFTGSGASYGFDLVPASDGVVTADIAADVAQDGNGNGNTAATQFSRSYDGTAPSVTLSSSAANPTNSSPIHMTAAFSEAVTGFTAGDVSAGNASVGNFSGSGSSYSFDLTPSSDGLVTADVSAAAAQDAAGNGNTSATQFSRTYDATAPTVTIDQASAQADPTSASPITFSVHFSESVTGFSASDVSLSGTAGATTALVSGSGDTYSVAVSGMSAAGSVVASVMGSAASDAAGNASSQSTSTDNTVGFLVAVPPTIAAGGGLCTDGPRVTVNVALADADTAASALSLTATSSNPAVLPPAKIILTGAGYSRQAILSPASKNGGVSTITFTVSDGQGSAQAIVTLIVGTQHNNVLVGAGGEDVILGLDGRDTLSGLGGSDLLCGGSAKDRIDGGGGADTLYGGIGDDVLNGGPAADILIGGKGNDQLTGGSEADFFSGGPGGHDTTTDFNPGQGDTTDGTIP